MRRRAAAALAHAAMRRATPCSQLDREPRLRIEPALREDQEACLKGVLGIVGLTKD